MNKSITNNPLKIHLYLTSPLAYVFRYKKKVFTEVETPYDNTDLMTTSAITSILRMQILPNLIASTPPHTDLVKNTEQVRLEAVPKAYACGTYEHADVGKRDEFFVFGRNATGWTDAADVQV